MLAKVLMAIISRHKCIKSIRCTPYTYTVLHVHLSIKERRLITSLGASPFYGQGFTTHTTHTVPGLQRFRASYVACPLFNSGMSLYYNSSLPRVGPIRSTSLWLSGIQKKEANFHRGLDLDATAREHSLPCLLVPTGHYLLGNYTVWHFQRGSDRRIKVMFSGGSVNEDPVNRVFQTMKIHLHKRYDRKLT